MKNTELCVIPVFKIHYLKRKASVIFDRGQELAVVIGYVRNLLADEELHKLFRYTRLKSNDVGLNVSKVATSCDPSTSLLYSSEFSLAMTKQGSCTLEATSKQVPCGLYITPVNRWNVLCMHLFYSVTYLFCTETISTLHSELDLHTVESQLSKLIGT